MRRDDVIAVAVSTDYGKPRPAMVVQTDALPEDHPSIIVCQMTSRLVDSVIFRVTINPDQSNGLRTRSQVMVDKPVAIRRERMGQQIGKLAAADIARLDAALAFVIGLSD